MTSQELMTLVADKIPVKIALLDNKKLGMIRQWQEIIYGGQLPLGQPAGAGLRQARRRVRHPGVPGPDAGRGRRRHPRRPGGRRPGAHLVRDRRGAERLPDDAGRQGPVRPDREVGRGGRMSADPSIERAGCPGRRAAPAVAPAAPPARALPGGGELRRHVLVAIVLDKPGVLNRVSSLMRARNFNIDSLAVSQTDREDMSRMTITLHGDDVAVEQAAKQLYRLIDVLKVQDVTSEPTVEHELAFVKIRATESNRAEVLRLVELSRGRVVDLADGSVIVEVTGTEVRDRRLRGARADLRHQGVGPHRCGRDGPRARGPSRRRSSDDSDGCTTTTMRTRRPWPGRRSRSSATGPGARPCAEPARERGRRRRRAGARVEEPGASPRRRACGSWTSPTRSRPPT